MSHGRSRCRKLKSLRSNNTRCEPTSGNHVQECHYRVTFRIVSRVKAL